MRKHRPCDSRCMNSLTDICACSCGGTNHGLGNIPYDPTQPRPMSQYLRKHGAHTSGLSDRTDSQQLILI